MSAVATVIRKCIRCGVKRRFAVQLTIGAHSGSSEYVTDAACLASFGPCEAEPDRVNGSRGRR